MLSMQHKISSKTHTETRLAQQRRMVEEVVKTILEDDRFPSRRQVNAILKQNKMSLAQSHVLESYRNILKKITCTGSLA
jgi:hypothetical protein